MSRYRRHPAEVTSDRLAAAREQWYQHFSGQELDALAAVRHALERIAERDDTRRVLKALGGEHR